MNKITAIGIIAMLIALVAVQTNAIGQEFGIVNCKPFSIIFGSGYSCNENNGIYRSFWNPGGYEKMTNFYAPAVPETPLYTFVTGGTTKTLTIVP